LTNGTQAKNVFWKVDGAVEINDYSEFKGTIVCNDGALKLNKGTNIDGRAFTTTGELNASAITVTIPSACIITGIIAPNKAEAATFSPNPFTTSTTINISDVSGYNSSELRIYNILGTMVMNKIITKRTTVLETNFPSGVYLYKLTGKNGTAQSGKLVSQR
jgi:hypothetical protein